MKIAFIGGASVQWIPKLVTDMALTPTLHGADLVLHDINAPGLDLLTQASRRIVEMAAADLRVTATTDRPEALRDADFVILCVAIGGLPAMRHDIEIPERYGIYQSVGDIVGPGGISRGLRHIPFAVTVAREMEALCPAAWMLNLTNPMTTICRAVTRTTSIRTVGLCHEVDNFRSRHLASIFEASADSILVEVAGVNHLPAILRASVNGKDGLRLLQAWLSKHTPLDFIEEHDPDPARDPFRDRLGVKFTLFRDLGVLFGAGDRHVAEFFPGFLADASGRGRQYGILLTTIEHRERLATQREADIQAFVAGRREHTLEKSVEQLAGVMAALAGGPAGRFVVNVPNRGQMEEYAARRRGGVRGRHRRPGGPPAGPGGVAVSRVRRLGASRGPARARGGSRVV